MFDTLLNVAVNMTQFLNFCFSILTIETFFKKPSKKFWKKSYGFKYCLLLLHNFEKGNKEIHANHILLELHL